LLGAAHGVACAVWARAGEWHLAASHPKVALPTDTAAAAAAWAARLRAPARWRAAAPPVPGLALRARAAHAAWPLRAGARTVGVFVAAGAAPERLEGALPFLALAAQAYARGSGAAPSAPHSQEEFLGAVLDALPLGVYVVDRDYRIVAINQARESGAQGIPRHEAIGRTVFEVLHREDPDRLRAELDEVLRSGEIRTYEAETADRRRYRLTRVPMRLGGADEVTHIIAIGEDVTEQRRIQEQIAHAEKLAALGQMVAGVMHEINNPLATIAACAEALRDRPEDRDDLLAMIESEVARASKIARDLLAFSRPPPSEKGLVDVQEAVEETLRLLRHHPRFRRIRVHREYVYDLPPVWADEERLLQVFVALCTNALDAMDDEGELRVRTEMVGDREVAISFIDSGHGIAPGDLPKIFEPFYTTKPPGKGTGLGLSICYGIIAEHGGRIEVDSALGVGSNFRVVLPRAPDPVPGPDASNPAPAAGS
jgi:two-component system NtrC family sensor kinase